MKPLSLKRFARRLTSSAMLYGLLGSTVRVGANIVLLPFMLRTLTQPELATWWVFVALGAFANLTDFGFGQAITRVYSFLWAGADDFEAVGLRSPTSNGTPNLPYLRRLTHTVKYLYWALGAAAAMLLAVGGTGFLACSAHPGGRGFWVAWAVYLSVIVWGLASSYWTLACQGINQVRDLQAANLFSGLCYAIVASVILLAGGGLFAIAVATAFRVWVTRYVCRTSYLARVPKVQEEPQGMDTKVLKKLWPNAWRFGLLSIGAYLFTNAGVLVCSHFLSEAETASYGLSVQVGVFIVSLATMWLTVKWPEITILRSQGRLHDMSTLFARRLFLSLATYLVLATAVMLAGNPLLELKGTHTRLLPAPFLLLFLAHLGQQLVYGQFASLVFTENVVAFHWLSVCSGTCVILLAIPLTSAIGLWGLLLAPVIASQPGNSWYPIWRGLRGQSLSPANFVRAMLFAPSSTLAQQEVRTLGGTTSRHES